jgi:hypothetical protein
LLTAADLIAADSDFDASRSPLAAKKKHGLVAVGAPHRRCRSLLRAGRLAAGGAGAPHRLGRGAQPRCARCPCHALGAAIALAACSFCCTAPSTCWAAATPAHAGTGTVMGVTFISYAFNLNLGSLVGGVAFRYRLYSRWGSTTDTITRVLGFSMLTNWLGYLVVAGAAFCFWPLALPPTGRSTTRDCACSVRRCCCWRGLPGAVRVGKGATWRVRGHAFSRRRFRMALLQLAMSCTNWSLMGGVIWFLLQGEVDYPQVLAVLLVGAVAGVVTHVPAGLGVLEAVFVALLSHRWPRASCWPRCWLPGALLPAAAGGGHGGLPGHRDAGQAAAVGPFVTPGRMACDQRALFAGNARLVH